jgi:hypothetical protein
MNTSKTSTGFPVTLIIGIAIFAGGLFMLVETSEFVTHAARTTGKVESVELGDADGATTYHPVFVYTDSAGVEHRKRSAYGSTTFRFSLGSHVKVLYDPNAPTRARIDSFESLWLFPLLFIGSSLVFITNYYRWKWSTARKSQAQTVGHTHDVTVPR